MTGGNPVDAYCYWRIDPAHPYTTGECQFVYTPVAAQVLTPFLRAAVRRRSSPSIRLVDLVAARRRWPGPATLFALLLPPVAAEINAANINLPMGLAIVRGVSLAGAVGVPAARRR